MKSIYLFFSVVLFSLLDTSVIAQTIDQPDLAYFIVASKNGTERNYKTGKRFLIKYKSGSSAQKTRVFFAGVSEGKIAMLPKTTSNEVVLIPPDSILLLRRIRPTQRIIYAAAGITLIGTGTAILDNVGNASGNSGAAVLIIPVIGAEVYFLCAVPVSLFFEKIFEKKRSSGWTFSIQRQ